MKGYSHKKGWIVTAAWISLTLWPVRGQSPFDQSNSQTASEIREHLEVFADRSLYVAGEQIFFMADYSRTGLPEDVPWSSVLYAELAGPGGSVVASGKFMITGEYSSGSLAIPPGILSGNYFLKCYTRWMRNAGEGHFSYLPVKILNPYRREVANPGGTGGGEGSATLRKYVKGGIQCNSDASLYRKGEEVSLRITATQSVPPGGFRCCLTVVPAGSVDTISGQILLEGTGEEGYGFQVSYLPDLDERPSLSGIVLLPDGSPAQHCTLYLSMLGQRPDLFTSVTDSHGRFSLLIPVDETDQEMFITPVQGRNGPLQIHIDQDFEGPGIPVEPDRFTLTAAERKVATGMAIRVQLSESYNSVDSLQNSHASQPGPSIPFYGSRVERVDLDDYVTLPTLEEVFINLVPGVDVQRKGGRWSFSFESDNNSIGFIDPLILVDHIPVFDTEALMSHDPREFKKIEVIRQVYIKGAVAFGGVISFYSRNGDMAGVDLPEGSYFFDFMQVKAPEDEEPEPVISGERIPDLRNTILWLDRVMIVRDSVHRITFRAPVVSGEYQVLVRGICAEDEVCAASARFRVQ